MSYSLRTFWPNVAEYETSAESPPCWYPPLTPTTVPWPKAAAVSLAADVVLATVGRAVFTIPVSFGKFAFGAYGPLTVLGVAGATVAWALVTTLSSRPKWLLTRLAALVTALFGIPDFLLFGTPGNPAGPVVILMGMHLAIAAITYVAMVTIAPVRGGAR